MPDWKSPNGKCDSLPIYEKDNGKCMASCGGNLYHKFGREKKPVWVLS